MRLLIDKLQTRVFEHKEQQFERNLHSICIEHNMAESFRLGVLIWEESTFASHRTSDSIKISFLCIWIATYIENWPNHLVNKKTKTQHSCSTSWEASTFALHQTNDSIKISNTWSTGKGNYNTWSVNGERKWFIRTPDTIAQLYNDSFRGDALLKRRGKKIPRTKDWNESLGGGALLKRHGKNS